MKKMRACIFAVLLSLSVFAMTACGGRNGSDPSANQSSASRDASSGQNSGNSGAASENTRAGAGESEASFQEESTGVLDGLMDDMESGVEDIMGDSEGMSNHADESRD